VKLRKSMLMAFLRCPYYAKRHYIDKVQFRVTLEMERGRLFHEKARYFFDWIDYDAALKNTGIIMQFLKKVPTLIRREIFNFLYFEKKSLELLIAQTDDPLKYWRPVATEFVWETEEAHGKIDRIDCLLNGTHCIVEYKLKRKASLTAYRRELMFYVYYYNQLLPFGKYATKYAIFFADSGDFILESPKSGTYAALLRSLDKWWWALAQQEFPRKRGDHCVYCNLLEECEE